MDRIWTVHDDDIKIGSASKYSLIIHTHVGSYVIYEKALTFQKIPIMELREIIIKAKLSDRIKMFV